MKRNIYTYRMIIEPDDVGYHGFVPLLKGVHTWGKTIEEAKKNLEEAIRCHIEGLLEDKETPPHEEDSVEIVETFTVNA